MNIAKQILMKDELTREDLIYLLLTRDEEEKKILFSTAMEYTKEYSGKGVGLRGIIELSNICKKNCYYCGIRSGNKNTERYLLNTSLVLEAAEHAWRRGLGSVVIQSGERQDKAFINHITDLIKQIKNISNDELGITLSCGEQSEEVYREWFEAGAHRYLLRIETSTADIYRRLHPNDKLHDFEQRKESLGLLQKVGYQTGTGVMIGLPYQTLEHLADDLLFMKNMSIDMVGMGPYIPHPDTPLFHRSHDIPDEASRLDLSLRMIALLRIMMKDINIAASTALNALDPYGRVKAIASGANVFMPNITPAMQACNYMLYEGKPIFSDMAENALGEFEDNISDLGFYVNYKAWGDSKHFYNRTEKKE